jgi:hypothetical protein
MADDRKPCCQDPANLREEDTGRAELAMRRCAVCGCRHFRLKADLATVLRPAGTKE